MGWFTRKNKKKAEMPPGGGDNLWEICPSCKAHIYKQEWTNNLKVCPQCSYHERIPCYERLALTLDPNSFKEINARVSTADPLNFVDAKGAYAEKAEETKSKLDLKEAVVTGFGTIKGTKVVVAVMDFRFLGGSLGSGTGQKIMMAAEYALKRRRPYIVFSASGGARMHEGIISLMQMARTCSAIARLKKEKVPYISVLTDPTTGGVSASFAMMGDLNISEPKALIGFAGRRVIEQTIKQKLPDDFQTAEYLLEHGFIDGIVPRSQMREFLGSVIKYWKPKL
jgi:acetyl-CoA carboxylase carboxyl transferase subunit beta